MSGRHPLAPPFVILVVVGDTTALLLAAIPPTTRSITMTTTTTTTTRNPSALTADGVLADYELHHSHIDSPISPSTGNDHHEIPNSPVDWDTTHRRVPPYRPINRVRDPLETRVYNSRVEQTFIGVMFTGVLTIAVSDAGPNCIKLASGAKAKVMGAIEC